MKLRRKHQERGESCILNSLSGFWVCANLLTPEVWTYEPWEIFLYTRLFFHWLFVVYLWQLYCISITRLLLNNQHVFALCVLHKSNCNPPCAILSILPLTYAFPFTQLDTEYRKKWDSLVIKLEVVDRDVSTGSEVVHWATHFPVSFSWFLITPKGRRQFVVCNVCLRGFFPLLS